MMFLPQPDPQHRLRMHNFQYMHRRRRGLELLSGEMFAFALLAVSRPEGVHYRSGAYTLHRIAPFCIIQRLGRCYGLFGPI